MHRTLLIESAVRGLLYVNGQFCGPVDREGQAFPAGQDAEIYMQMFPFEPEAAMLTAEMTLRGGRIARLEPQGSCYALTWPDGIIQLELRPQTGGAQDDAAQAERTAASGTLLRYLILRLAGDERAAAMLMRPQDGLMLAGYDAAVPLRFAPVSADERYDECAGLVRRIMPNAAVVDTALAATVPAGQGRRLIERMEIMRT